MSPRTVDNRGHSRQNPRSDRGHHRGHTVDTPTVDTERGGYIPLSGPGHWRGDPAEIVAASVPDPLVLLRRLAGLVPTWHRDAACAGQPVGIFFPGLGERNTTAMELCGRCPVRVQCLDWAIAEGIGHGVFGGMSSAARRAHARGRA